MKHKKYFATIGLLMCTNTAITWVLDDSLSTLPQHMAAIESLEPDLFQLPLLSSEDNANALLPAVTEIPTPMPAEPKSSTEVTTKKHPTLQKKISALTPQDRANKKYNAGLIKVSLGSYAEAEKLFLEALKEYPTHTLSRVQLSKLSILNNDYLTAEQWLTEHPASFSNHPTYLQTLALIYERKGKKEEALKILEQVPTEHRESIEFYSLLASLYQQTGNHVLAQRYYHGLLNREPENTTWLLGLSVSLDSGGEKKMAYAYYKKIMNKRDIDPQILSFVEGRISHLRKNYGNK